jgi:RecB family endonuclease NucS
MAWRGPIGYAIDEKSLENLLVNRLDLLERGLTLIKRQFSVGVGVLDLLCLDRRRNLVVVEIKRPRADSRAVVGQISGYMGWVRQHMAGPGQLVRGIIVVGREDERLRCSLGVLENVIVRTFL